MLQSRRLTYHTVPQASAAYLECCSSYNWGNESFGKGFLDLSKDAHGSIDLLDGGSPGGVVGGLPPGFPAPPDCCGGVEPGGVVLPPG